MAESTPSPKAILRGHKAQIHAATFVRQNERLATGDAEGWVVLWDLTIMRPRAVWRAHENAILGMKGWGRDKIITYVLFLMAWNLFLLLTGVSKDMVAITSSSCGRLQRRMRVGSAFLCPWRTPPRHAPSLGCFICWK